VGSQAGGSPPPGQNSGAKGESTPEEDAKELDSAKGR
jgi:hypothetical protein